MGIIEGCKARDLEGLTNELQGRLGSEAQNKFSPRTTTPGLSPEDLGAGVGYQCGQYLQQIEKSVDDSPRIRGGQRKMDGFLEALKAGAALKTEIAGLYPDHKMETVEPEKRNVATGFAPLQLGYSANTNSRKKVTVLLDPPPSINISKVNQKYFEITVKHFALVLEGEDGDVLVIPNYKKHSISFNGVPYSPSSPK